MAKGSGVNAKLLMQLEASALRGGTTRHHNSNQQEGRNLGIFDFVKDFADKIIDVALGGIDVGPLPVCEDSTFKPNPDTYYTIGVNNLVWGVKTIIYGTPTRVTLTSDKTADGSHWRFIEQSSGEWIIRNRLTGQAVGINVETRASGSNHYAATTLEEDTITFQATCNKNQTKVFLDGQGFGSSFARCDIKGCLERSFISMGKNGRFERANSCTNFKSCEDVLAGSKQQSSSRCGIFAKRIACNRRLPVPQQKLKQKWLIREVENFTPRGALEEIKVDNVEGPGIYADRK